jgi:hypothetical protein
LVQSAEQPGELFLPAEVGALYSAERVLGLNGLGLATGAYGTVIGAGIFAVLGLAV